MRTVELFSGTSSFSKYASKIGHETLTVDFLEIFKPDILLDLTKEFNDLLLTKIVQADIIWMSPPCTTFSMSSGNKHWTKNRKPRTKEAIIGKTLLDRCKIIADFCERYDKIYFIENPRARARWFLPIENRKTAWYCQYGDTRAKPTDIWTNLKNWKPKTCKNNNKNCSHQRAPRGSKTGTQGLKNAKERGVIPEGLFEEIFNVISR